MRGPQPWKTERARTLRSRPISAETALWQKLRGRRLGGLKFIRQAPVSSFFVDFLCRELKIIVEVDGATHATEHEKQSDAVRTAHLEGEGYRVYRVQNTDIYHNIDGVLDTLLDFCQSCEGQ
ncbi:MAG: DUF559 domain-containing protein [Pseudomonadota bacterium]